jgi:hypothetical protein
MPRPWARDACWVRRRIQDGEVARGRVSKQVHTVETEMHAQRLVADKPITAVAGLVGRIF